MITPTEIQQKALRWYLPFLQSWLRNESFFPCTLPAGSPPAEFSAFRKAVELLYSQSKERRGCGYSIESQFKRMRQHGDQNLPVRIVIETQQDLLQMLDKEDEFEHFQQDVLLIRRRIPQLNEWMLRFPQHVIDHHGDWNGLLAVCAYFWTILGQICTFVSYPFPFTQNSLNSIVVFYKNCSSFSFP